MSFATNKKAYHDYEIVETYEAGIELVGTEVKSVKASRINLKESHVRVKDGEIFLINCHISPYEQGNRENVDPTRTRKLLLHKKEILKLGSRAQEKGLAIIALSVYEKHRRVKVQVALGRGKKLHDKRQTMKEKDMNREMQRAVKDRNR